jgi:RNA polymerase sigma-70 factor (ECF subfamily)
MAILRGSLYALSSAARASNDRPDDDHDDIEAARDDARADVSDRVALGVLYQTYAPAIYARCYRLLHSDVAARDATQEAFARVLGHDRSVLTGDEGLHYLYRVSTNVCFNVLREQRVREHAAPELALRASELASPERGHADRQFVAAILDRCDETAAAIAVMHYIDGMTQVEVAEVLSITRRTVFNRLRRLESLAADLLRSSKRGRQDQT